MTSMVHHEVRDNGDDITYSGGNYTKWVRASSNARRAGLCRRRVRYWQRQANKWAPHHMLYRHADGMITSGNLRGIAKVRIIA